MKMIIYHYDVNKVKTKNIENIMKIIIAIVIMESLLIKKIMIYQIHN